MTMGLFQTKPVVCGPAPSPAKRLAVPACHQWRSWALQLDPQL